MPFAALVLAASVQTAPPDPYAILSGARTYWQSQRYPAVVDYTIHTQATDRGRPDGRHYTARWFANDGQIEIHPVSAEEEAHPYVPGGGFNFGPFSIGGPHDGGGVKGDLVGLPLLAPNYSFGISPYVPPSRESRAQIVAEIRERFHDPGVDKVEALSRADGPPVIASVTSAKRDYAIDLVGTEAYGDHLDYHLRLRALRDPWHLRLRDLWIDERTYATDRLVEDGNFTLKYSTKIPWSVTFADVDGARYITSESAQLPLKTGLRSSLQDFRVGFEAIVPGAGTFWPGVPDPGSPQLIEPE